MDEARLRRKLEQGEGHTEGSISSKLSRARRAEVVIGADLDYVVADDDRTYWALVGIDKSNLTKGVIGDLSNAVRWYYRAVNGRGFPRLDAYERGMRSR